MKMSNSSGEVFGIAIPSDCAIRPQFGSPPCSAAFTSGEFATARATRLDDTVGAAAHDHAADPLGALAVAHDVQRELAQRPVQRLAEAHAVLAVGLDRTPDAPGRLQDHRVVGGELPVDGDAIERALDAQPEQQIGEARRPAPRRSGRSRASSRTRARSSPRPWPARSAAPCRTAARRRPRPPWRTCPWSGSPPRSRRARTRAGPPRARARPRMTSPASSSTPITPVDATATWSSCTPPTIAAAPWQRAASSKPRLPVAALALPELTTRTRIASRRVRSLVSCDRRGEDAGLREARRGHAVRRRADHQPHVEPAARLAARRTPPRP